jgi:hypothetical protein
MQNLSPFTCRRLHRLPKLVSVWEGDRRCLASTDGTGLEGEVGDCIIWVDSTQGVIRALSMVPGDTGNEAVVRTLVQAIEHPQSSVEPARPRKIVVKNRELQFFLRGALQDLDIEVDYTAELPLIDEIFENLLQADMIDSAALPELYANRLLQQAATIWQDAPWYLLSEQEILAIDLNAWNIETLYVSVLGMADVEYGLLLYRNLDSLKQFRQRVLTSQNASPKELQQAFLDQDCLFVNFEPIHDDDKVFEDVSGTRTIDYEFGSIHPLEGLRTALADEEAATLIVVLEAIHRFIKKHGTHLEDLALEPLSNRFRIPNPDADAVAAHLTVTIRTLPEVSSELLQQTEELGVEATDLLLPTPQIRDDVIPDGSLILLTELSSDLMADILNHPKIYHQAPLKKGRKFSKPTPWPTLIIQTTRPKATALIETFHAAGGIEALCFNPGSDPFSHQLYQLGLLRTADGNFHLFHEYEMDNATHRQALEKWQAGQDQSQGRCGIVIASGVSGSARGTPQLKDMMAFFEAETLDFETLGLAPLVLNYALDFEL